MQGTQEGVGWLSLSRREWKPRVVKKGLGKERPKRALMQSEEGHPPETDKCWGTVGRGLDTHKRSKKKREVGGVNQADLRSDKGKEVHIVQASQCEMCCGQIGMEKKWLEASGKQWMFLYH